MFKRQEISNKKLISKSAYAVALTVPFISLFCETKASKIISGENQLFVENKLSESYQFTHKVDENKFNLNLDELLISEETSQKDEKNSDPKERILDKDRFRQDLGGVIDAYEEILKRIEKESSNAT